MKKIILSIILVVLTIQIGFAQGYKNKRFAASYEYGYSFLGRYFIYDSNVLSRHTGSLSYALSRRFSIDAKFNYAKKTLNANEGVFGLGSRDFIGYSEFSQLTEYSGFRNAMIEDFTFGVSIKYFAKSNGCYAPIGKYFALGFEQGFQNGATVLPPTDINEQPELAYDRTARETLRLISFTYGRNVLLKEKFLLGYGLTMSISQFRFLQFRRHIARPFISLGYIF